MSLIKSCGNVDISLLRHGAKDGVRVGEQLSRRSKLSRDAVVEDENEIVVDDGVYAVCDREDSRAARLDRIAQRNLNQRAEIVIFF